MKPTQRPRCHTYSFRRALAGSPQRCLLSLIGLAVVMVLAAWSLPRERIPRSAASVFVGEDPAVRASGAADQTAAGVDGASEFAVSVLRDIGAVSTPGAICMDGADILLTSFATGSDGDCDQFTFSGSRSSGDFDWRVRVRSVEQGDLWAGGGLMVRADTETNGVFAAILTTPGQGGSYFQHRAAAGGDSVRSGFFPANHPHTWLRLQRVDDLLTAYAGVDGATWTRVGQAEVNLPAEVDIGLAGLSGDAAQPITTRFAELGKVTAAAATSLADLPFEPMGASSRNTELVISEIMYHPRDALSTNSLEFVELHNPGGIFEDLTGFCLDGDIAFTFPDGTILAAGGYLVVARIPGELEAAYGITGVLGPYEGSLPNNQGTVRVLNELGGIMLEVEYGSSAPWPAAADGSGHSLVLRRPSYGERDPRAWGRSDRVDGSPGQYDAVTVDPLDALCINEFLAHTDDPVLDQVELFNAGDAPLTLDGLIISDDPGADRFVVPPGTTLSVGGYRVYDQNSLGFAFSAAGGFILLKTPDGTRVVDAVQYGGQENGVSTGRYPDGAPTMFRLQGTSFGSANPRIAVGDVLINELMAHPISGDDDDQFVELHNPTGAARDLSGWTLTDGIRFEFPAGTLIPAGGYLVVARNRERMLSRYPGLSPSLVLGDFGGRLSHGSERVTLAMPDEILDDNGATNTIDIVVNEVTYFLGGRWGQWVDGGGSSLELIDPRADTRLVPNWAGSDETAKAPWTLIEVTDVLDNGMGGQSPNRFEMLLQGAGECLVDEVECRDGGGTNIIPNPTFDDSAAGWVGQGTHRLTARTTHDAYAGSGALRVIASGRGDTGANRVRAAMNGTLSTGQTGTLRAQARWLAGNPYLLLRVRGNWIEAPGVLTVPTDLGTPGAVNSRRVANAPPAVVDVMHSPVQPLPDEAVRVTARVDDPDGIALVTLGYRLDPGTTITDLAMTDDGTNRDARAGDGVYTAEIPGQVNGSMVAFAIQAEDAGGRSARFPDRSPVAEGLIHFGREDRAVSLGTYHIWCTQDTISTWSFREPNSNDPLDCTFTYGQARVIYQGGILYSGSPFHTGRYQTPLRYPCDYELEFPADDLFLGTDDFVLVVQNPAVNDFFLPDRTAQTEATSYWIGRKLGQIYMHRRWVFVYLNGSHRPYVYEDTQQPNADLLDVYFPDDPAARLHKIEDWFEFDDAGSDFSYSTATLQNYTTTDGRKDLARYRWTWRPRAGTEPNDFSSLFSIVDAVGAPSPEPYTSRTESLIDLRNWLAPIAVHHIVGDWDSYGYQRGKNMFAYKPARGGWRLLLWDIDFSLGANDSDGPTTSLFSTSGNYGSGDPRMVRMFNHPPFRRLYLSIMQDAAEGPLAPGVADPILDERYQLLRDNNIPVADPVSIKDYMAARRAYILSQMPAVSFSVDPPPSSISGNLLTLTGEAPIEVRSILVNGTAYPVTWTGVTDWSIAVLLGLGAQIVEVRALDRDGGLIATEVHTVTSTAAAVDPADWVVINEIMHHPVEPGGAYVEIHNTHPTAAFDLDGWRLNGLDYRFPTGAWLAPGGFKVVAENRFDYAKAYGALTALAAEYDGTLDPEGETLTLLAPGAPPGAEAVVDRVRYEASAPWPAGALEPGTSLQLVDAAQDNSRVGNWAVGGGTVIVTPPWKQATATSIAGGSDLFFLYLVTAGDVYIDDVSLVAGSNPGVGQNLVVNGGFESNLSGPWIVFGDEANVTRSTEDTHSGQYSLHLASAGSVYAYQFVDPDPNQGQTYSLRLWYREGTSAGPLVALLNESDLSTEIDLAPSGGLFGEATPARANAVAGTREPYPPVWLNELQTEQFTGPTNAAGEHVPWIELHQAGAAAQSLDGYYLALDTNNLLDEAFAAGAGLTNGDYRIVFSDGRTDLASPVEWHTSFTLPATTGLVMLTRNGADGPEVVDYLKYTVVPAESSYGDVPDGQPFYRQIMHRATAGESNNGAVAPVEVVISEWMADNSGAGGLVDPADGDGDDWFELYNPGPAEADLGGYYLTDELVTPLKYLIPPGYTIPAGGYLLVWADGEPEQNHPALPHLHADFRLSADGEAIGLFAPDRTPIDTVVFGAQTEDVSEGRIPLPVGPVLSLAPTPGGGNHLTLPAVRPAIGAMQFHPGPTLVLDYSVIAGGAYHLEATEDPLDGTPVVLGLDRMAFDDEMTDTIVLPAAPDPHRIYFIRRVR